MPLSSDEFWWITHRKQIWKILLDVKRDKISCIAAEKEIRKILYGEKRKEWNSLPPVIKFDQEEQ